MRSGNKLGLRTAFGLGLGATILLTAGCIPEPAPLTPEEQARHDAQAAEDAIPQSVKNCRPDVRRPLPSAAGTVTTTDTRRGNVYACEYFLDMAIPFNTPVRLYETERSTVESSSFRVDGEVAGLALLGSGILDGRVSATGATDSRKVVALTFEDTDGNLQTAVVNNSDTVIHPFTPAKNCKPEKLSCGVSVEFQIPDTVLWEKKGDEKQTSIWYTSTEIVVAGVYHRYPSNGTVSKVSVPTPGDVDGFSVSGGPANVGQVISSLVRKNGIIINIPRDQLGE